MGEDADLSIFGVGLVDEQAVAVDRVRIEEVARRTAAAEGARGELSILLVDAGRMAELNARFLGERGPTDVLSFPVDGLVRGPVPAGSPPPLIGEVILCPEVAAAQATAGLDAELDLLVAHGVLHLMGYDHDTEQSAEAMRARERAATGRSGARAT